MPLPSAAPSDPRAGLLRLAVLVVMAVLLADVATKNWAVSALDGRAVDWGVVTLAVVENDGLAFSVAAGALGAGALLALRLTLLAGVVLLAVRFGTGQRRYAVGFALLVGGGLGNALDLLFRGGAVVDFIGAGPAAPGGPVAAGIVMNLADLWILTGIALLYPLFRRMGLGVQRRLRAMEGRVLR